MNVTIVNVKTPLRHRKSRYGNNIAAYAFIAPTVLGIIVFVLYPVIESLRLSFYSTNYITQTWVGLDNYKTILKDPDFVGALYNTVYMGVLGLLLNIPGAFIIASMINACRWGKNYFKSAIYIPNITSVVAASTIFLSLFYPTDIGAINYILKKLFGIGPFGWFIDARIARVTVVIMSTWQSIGYNTLIFLAGLQSVPRELYEAAEVDGATALKRWRYITIPSMKPIFVFVFITGVIGAMQRFGDVWMIGGNTGQPGGTLRTVVLYIYAIGFQGMRFGLASAAAYILFFIIFALTLINVRLIKWDSD